MSKSKILMYLSLFTLLIVRFPVGDFALNYSRLFNMNISPTWMEFFRSIQNSTYYFWERYSFVLIGIIILVTRNNLSKLNIDRGFLILFVVGGALFCWHY